jgi:hypothetical protein
MAGGPARRRGGGHAPGVHRPAAGRSGHRRLRGGGGAGAGEAGDHAAPAGHEAARPGRAGGGGAALPQAPSLPNAGELRFYLAEALYRLERWEEAAEEYRQVADAGGRHAAEAAEAAAICGKNAGAGPRLASTSVVRGCVRPDGRRQAPAR